MRDEAKVKEILKRCALIGNTCILRNAFNHELFLAHLLTIVAQTKDLGMKMDLPLLKNYYEGTITTFFLVFIDEGHRLLPTGARVVFDNHHPPVPLRRGGVNEIGATPKEVAAFVLQELLQPYPVRLWVKVTVPADDPFRREVEKETDEGVNGRVEGLRVPVRFCSKATRSYPPNGLVLGHLIGG